MRMRYKKTQLYEIHIPERNERFYARYVSHQKFPDSSIVKLPFHIFKKTEPTKYHDSAPPMPHNYWLSESYIKKACIKIRKVEKWEEILIRLEGENEGEGKTVLTILVM